MIPLCCEVRACPSGSIDTGPAQACHAWHGHGIAGVERRHSGKAIVTIEYNRNRGVWEVQVDHRHVDRVLLVSQYNTRLVSVLRLHHLVASGSERLGQGPPHEALATHQRTWGGLCRPSPA